MPWAAAAAVGGALITGYMSSEASDDAAETAAGAQTASAQAGVAEQRAQFEAMREILKPYVQAGSSAMTAQEGLLGLQGPEAQRAAYAGIEGSPAFGALAQQGENAMLQNASATGGLRGGNIQGALAQFRPQLLSQMIDSQFNKLGNLSQLGQASAAGVGAAGLNTGSNIANLFGQQGQAAAGAALAQGQASANMWGGIGSAAGNAISNWPTSSPQPVAQTTYDMQQPGMTGLGF